MSELYYLAYGSNLHPLRIGDRLGQIERMGTVALPGWRLALHKRGEDGSGKGNLVRCDDSEAWGVVYRLDGNMKALLDEFEGDGYDCVSLQTVLQQSGHSETLDCFAYLAMSDWVDDTLLPHDWYAELIEHGARYAGLPAAYLRWIAQHPRQADAQGQQRHAALLTRLRAEAGSANSD